jgi:type IV pilus assembly protein PilX
MTKHSLRSRAFPRPTIHREGGVVLIIALVMLVVISLLATFSIRGALSSESVSGNVRTTQMASQAAEIALRYCEDKVVAYAKSGPPQNAGQLGGIPLQPASSSPLGVSTTVWDTNRSGVVYVLPSSVVNGTVTYKRMPECIAEQVATVSTAGGTTTLSTTATYLITARGFGPEVAGCDPTAFPPTAGACSRPDGSEVWLQSTLEAL